MSLNMPISNLDDFFDPKLFKNNQDPATFYTTLFSSFMEYSPLLAWITDAAGTIVYMNNNYQKAVGLSCNDLGKNIFELFPEPVANEYYVNNLKVLQDNLPVEAVESGDNKNTDARIYKVVKFPVAVAGANMVAGWAVDITMQMKLQEQVINHEKATMHTIVSSVIEAKEAERKELSNLLRDQINQALVASKLMLESSMENSTPTTFMAYDNIQKSIQQIKELSAELNPDTPEELGLQSAIQELSSHYNIDVNLNLSNETAGDFDKDLRLGIYRIVQYCGILYLKLPGTGKPLIEVNAGAEKVVCTIYIWQDGQQLDVMGTKEFKHIFNRTNYLKGTLTFADNQILIVLPVAL